MLNLPKLSKLNKAAAKTTAVYILEHSWSNFGIGIGTLIFHIVFIYICDRLWENRAQRGMCRRRKKIALVLKIVLNKPNEGNG